MIYYLAVLYKLSQYLEDSQEILLGFGTRQYLVQWFGIISLNVPHISLAQIS